MEEIKQKGLFVIRYGISFALLLLLVMVMFIMDGVRIRQKTEVSLIRTDSVYVAVVRSDNPLQVAPTDTVKIEVEGAQFLFRLTGENRESGYLKLQAIDSLPPQIDQALLFDGKIVGPETRLRDFIFVWKI